MVADCPSEEELALHVDGELPTLERQDVAAHLHVCEDCRRLVGALAAAKTRISSHQVSPIFPATTWRWRTGTRVGRLVIQGPLGRGGMGEVYEAHDLELDRHVAVKVARVDDPKQNAKLLSEARLLAMFNHPNVVRVFDVGTYDQATYFVLERAPGQTLQHWLSSARRTVRGVLDQFVELADGCAALHDAGLVHRDIKPGNVLVAAEGKVMLSDFGLVGTSEAGRYGTPGFIAPEVEDGEAATAASDQYSFCVTLDRALALCRGRVPGHVRRALARGTSRDPAHRFDSMRELAFELRPRGRRWAFLVVAALPLLGFLPGLTADPDCGWAETAWPDASGQPDVVRYQQAWTKTATEACDKRWNDEIRVCLLAQRREAEALLDARNSADRMVEGLWATFEPERCISDLAADRTSAEVRALVERSYTAKLTGDMQQALGLAAEATALAHERGSPQDALLALRNAAYFALDVGELERSRERFEAAYWIALQLDAPAEMADSALALMNAFNLESNAAGAQRWYRKATAALERMPVEDHDVWMDAELGAAFMHQNNGALEASMLAAQRALAHARLIPGFRDIGSIELIVGDTMAAAGDWRGARDYIERGVESTRVEFGEDSISYANAVGTFGNFCGRSLGDYECAAEKGRQGLAGVEKYDVQGVFVPLAYVDTALALLELGRVEDAQPYVDKAQEQFDAYFPPEHPQRVWIAMLRTAAARESGELDEAKQLAEEGVQFASRVLGPSHPNTGAMIAMLAEVHLEAGDGRAALRRFDEALEIADQVMGPDHSRLAPTLLGRADALSALGDRPAAEAAYRRVLALDVPEAWARRASEALQGSQRLPGSP